MTRFLLFNILCLLISLTFSAPADDLVTSFPGVDKIKSSIYSGYLNIENNRKLHYVLVESESSPASDPIVLWLNGGPGCSSLLGFLEEIGPYAFSEDGKGESNEYTWNKSANIIYLESPSGVGFSPASGSIETSDLLTAKDNLSAVLSFFEKFPEYKGRDFYLTGESYAGIYVPYLASSIIDYNDTNSNNKINLKGLLLGNPVSDWSYEGEKAMIDFSFTHALYSMEQRKDYEHSCLNKYNEEDCKNAKNSIYNSIKGIFIYDIYRDCIPPKKSSNRQLTGGNKLDYLLPLIEPCSGSKGEFNLTSYFNKPDVKVAFHVDNIEYKNCNYDILQKYTFSDIGSINIYPKLISNNLRIMIFSGDSDLVVPYTGTLNWINKLNLPIVSPWRYWGLDLDKEFLAGYVQEYTGLTFVTVRKVGHMVPQWKRKEAYKIFSSFINEIPL
jgi:serine carboxypeptidase-like clade 2